MNPMFIDIVTALTRWALSGVFGYLVAKGVLTNEQITWLTSGIAMGLITVGLTVWATIKKRRKLVTAMATPTVVSEKEVEQMVASGQAPPVSVPKTRAPHLEGSPNPKLEGEENS